MLKIKYTFRNINPKEKARVKDYILQKINRINRLLSRYQDKECLLEIKADGFATKSAYQVEFILSLPKKQFIASEDDHTLVEAIDLSLDKLTNQIRKFINQK